MLLYSAITPKSEDKYVVKVFSWSEFHLSEMTLLQNPYFNTLPPLLVYVIMECPLSETKFHSIKNLMNSVQVYLRVEGVTNSQTAICTWEKPKLTTAPDFPAIIKVEIILEQR